LSIIYAKLGRYSSDFRAGFWGLRALGGTKKQKKGGFLACIWARKVVYSVIRIGTMGRLKAPGDSRFFV
jgi:hypothetical protein